MTSPAMPVAPPTVGPGRAPTGPPSAPPPSVPLTFLFLAALGLVIFGIALALGADKAVVAPTHPGAVGAAHSGLLVFLSTAVLGALHQFAPVVGARPLRSVPVARVTAVVFFGGAVVLAGAFAHVGSAWLVPWGGAAAFTGVVLAAWNLSGPLSSRQGGTPLVGLRLSVTFLVVTAAFGIVYAFNREAGWFPLFPERVMAHAHLGLLGWLGLTYVAVAEKLWPMFLLAHRPGARSGARAVSYLAAGSALLAPGLLFEIQPLAVAGGTLAVAGLLAHLVSLGGVIRHRRRRLELLHAFVLAAAVAMVVGIALGAVAGIGDIDVDTRFRLAAAEVAALAAWLTLAVIGHAHKIVPFISWGMLRSRGVTTAPGGGPLLFQHLFDARVARLTFVVVVASEAAVVGGLLARSEPVMVAGALGLIATGALVFGNLGLGPRRAARAARSLA